LSLASSSQNNERTILIDFVFKRNVKTRALKHSSFALLEEEGKEEAFFVLLNASSLLFVGFCEFEQRSLKERDLEFAGGRSIGKFLRKRIHSFGNKERERETNKHATLKRFKRIRRKDGILREHSETAEIGRVFRQRRRER
jgi:hypothetical protein